MWTYNDELYHYGVKGMRWGHRKRYIRKGRRRGSPDNLISKGRYYLDKQNIRKTLSQKDKQNELDHEKHNRIVKEAKRTGKSAAEIEWEENQHKKFSLSDNQKKVLKYGAIAAAAALATYGVYKSGILSNPNTKLTGNSGFLSNLNPDSGKTDFLKRAFSNVNDWAAYDNTLANKIAINAKLTESSGKWWNELSHGEKKAIEIYSNSSYTAMNNALWAAKGRPIDEFAKGFLANTIKDANNALKKASFPETMVCTQGLSLDKACSFLGCTPNELINASKNSKAASKFIGAVNTNHGFFSTTTASNGGFSGGVKYKVLTPKGAKAMYIEHISAFGDLVHPPGWDGKKSGGPPFSSEFETLFAAGSKFKTKGIQYNESGGFIEVALEYIFDD